MLNATAQGTGGADIDRKIDDLATRNKLMSNRLRELELENFKLSQRLDSIEGKTQSQLNRAQELQAQNERAMNLALDGFSNKFE